MTRGAAARGALAAGCVLAACSHPAAPRPAPDAAHPRDAAAPPHADAAAAVDVSTVVEGPTGTVEGTVFLDGPLRPGAALTVPPAFATHPGCRDAALRYAQPFDITTPGPMPGALVAAEAHSAAPPPSRERTLVFRDCDISPRVLFATLQDHIVFHAGTHQTHLPHIFGYNSAIDQLLIPGQEDLRHPFTHPGRYPVGARTMPDWAQSILFILPNRFSEQTDAAGHYRLEHVPVGHVLVHAWYPGAVQAQVVVDVQAGQTAHADFHLRQAPPEVHAPPPDAGNVPVPP